MKPEAKWIECKALWIYLASVALDGPRRKVVFQFQIRSKYQLNLADAILEMRPINKACQLDDVCIEVYHRCVLVETT